MAPMVHCPQEFFQPIPIGERTLRTGCGIGKRPRNLVSADAKKVSCVECRQYAIKQLTDRIEKTKLVLNLDIAYFDESISKDLLEAQMRADMAALAAWETLSGCL